MNDSEMWEELNDQYGSADDDVRKALRVINEKFAAIAFGRSRENPTEDEIALLEDAIRRRSAIDQSMTEFMRTRFGVDG